MRILVYHGDCGDEYWLADTPERLIAAQRKLFQRLDDWGCYDDGVDHIIQARAGNIRAIRWILDFHQNYEDEGWDIEEVMDPLT